MPITKRSGDLIFFTICSKNFLGYALALYRSLVAHQASVHFHVAVCDDLSNFDRLQFPFEILSIDQLGIPNFDEMRRRYNITELNTAIKPFVFSYLFDSQPNQPVVYLDPDIFIVSPLDELNQLIEAGADCVLTPHISEPAEYAEMSDDKFLQYGIYNLGFCMLRGTDEVRRVASWWGRRLETHCVIDLPNGLFVDQKWADLLPAFISNTKILRHPGYNVAYWNLSQRRVRREEDVWTVNGEPLRFFHFSGNKIEDTSILSRHSSQFSIGNSGDVSLLLDQYRDEVFFNGHSHYTTVPYGFSWSGSSGHNAHTDESIARERQSRKGDIPHLPLLKSRSLQEYDVARSFLQNVIRDREQVEQEAIPFGEDAFRLTGYCACCAKTHSFQVSGMYSSRTLADGRVVPNWREHLNCLACGLVNRVRASLQIFRQEFSPAETDSIYITGAITSTYSWVKERFANTTGSEFFPDARLSGEIRNGVLHQDIQSMSFKDHSFDHVLSFDVLEHVPYHNKAFEEFFRCLKPGGRLLFTAPFSAALNDHHVQAELSSSGELIIHGEPEYHGNPVDMEKGSLSFRRYGWRVLDELRKVGFEDCEVLTYWSKELLYFGNPQHVICATKRAIA